MVDELINEATYQGYAVEALAIDRKPGVTSDTGFVELDIEVIKQFILKPEFRLWQVARAAEPAGPFPITVADRLLRPSRSGEILPPSIKGFRRGGSLVMNSKLKKTDGTEEQVGNGTVLTPMYLAASGIEEIEEDLESAIKHEEGRLRVNLVDIRDFWGGHGTPLAGRYNIVRENGGHDDSTVDPATKKPFTAFQVFNYIALCLPGSPAILNHADIKDELKYPAPVNLDMKFELPVEWFKKMLDAYDLECHLTHDSQLVLLKRGAAHLVRNFRSVPMGPRNPLPESILPENPVVEKKTFFTLNRPEAATVAGDRRQRRYAATCVPAFIDEDGGVRKLDELPLLWGYSMEDALEQAMLRSEKAYDNVPGSDANQKFARVRIARKYFFKLFVPAMFFAEPPTPPGLGAVDLTSGASVFWPDERSANPFLPMKDPWWLPNELDTLATVPGKSPSAPVNKDGKVLVETDIVVRANVIDQRHVTDLDAIKEIIDGFIKRHEAVAQEFGRRREINRKYAELLRTMNKPDEFKELGSFAEVGVVISKGKDLAIASFPVGILNTVDDIKKRNAAKRLMLGVDVLLTDFEIRELDAQELEVQKEIQKLKSNRKALEDDLEDYGFAKLWLNAPWGVVDEGRFTVQKERGFILFNEIVGIMEGPGTYDKELTKLQSAGHVQVTFNTEVVLGTPEEFSTLTFMAPLKEGGEVSLVRISEPTTLKPAIINEPDLVMYEDESGNVMNMKEVGEKAARLAKAVLDVPTQQIGYAYVYPAFHRVVTDDSVNQVSWDFNGEIATTRIVANNPDIDMGASSLARKRRAEDLLYDRKALYGKKRS